MSVGVVAVDLEGVGKLYGRLFVLALVGVALLKPAEFVIFRIGQMTASASE